MKTIEIEDFEFLRDIPSELIEANQKLVQQRKENSKMRTIMWIAIGISVAVIIAAMLYYETNKSKQDNEE